MHGIGRRKEAKGLHESMTYLDLILRLGNFLILATGLFYAILRFGLKRERFSFLNLTLDAKVMHDAGEVKLVSIVISLENRGDTRIKARRKREAKEFLYDDGWDQCMHAGTLKIRPIPIEKEPLFFEWYSLKPMKAKISRRHTEGVNTTEENLEQINYLNEFEDPKVDYREVDFWLEPKESYIGGLPIWLRPGMYCAKVFFLGPRKKYQDDEYWSHTMIFHVEPAVSPNNTIQPTTFSGG